MNDEDLITPEEAADILSRRAGYRITSADLKQLRRHGRVKAAKQGTRMTLYERSEIEQAPLPKKRNPEPFNIQEVEEGQSQTQEESDYVEPWENIRPRLRKDQQQVTTENLSIDLDLDLLPAARSLPSRDVFVAYSYVDFDFVQNLIKKVEQAGFKVWTGDRISDELGLGGRPDLHRSYAVYTAITATIQAATALIVVLTPEARHSEYMTYEWSLALGQGIGVIPVVSRPMDYIHPALEMRVRLDFTHPRNRPWEKLIEGLNYLAQIKSNAGHHQ